MTSKGGYISQIQPYSIHDGNGIRTTVFMAGCPLRCRWCANPETWASPGTFMTASQVVDQVMGSAVFFRASGGGVTLSGGEPGFQPDFLNALTFAFDQLVVDIAIETSGQFCWRSVEPSLSRMSQIFVDIKHMDDRVHRVVTGFGNDVILENIKRIGGLGIPTVVRIPLIPGINDSVENLQRTAAFVGRWVPRGQVEILPYHNLASGKYSGLGLQSYDYVVPEKEAVAWARRQIEATGVSTVDLR